MKLLTLNTHSLVEKEYEKKLKDFVDAVSREVPDIIALQEINQTCNAPVLREMDSEKNILEENTLGKAVLTEDILIEKNANKIWETYCPCNGSMLIRKDNHAYNAVKMLSERGIQYYWTWLGMKLGYGKYDEGMAIFSRSRILETDVLLISGMDDYQNWKTRKIIGVRTEACPDSWFYSVHMGWWQDEEEPFKEQWKRIASHMENREMVWLMGDFNSPAKVKGEGYELIEKAGWHDSFLLAREKDNGITVGTVIDGWKDKIKSTDGNPDGNVVGMRIDQIWSSKEVPVKSSKVIFNGKNEPVVSDHYGIVIEL